MSKGTEEPPPTYDEAVPNQQPPPAQVLPPSYVATEGTTTYPPPPPTQPNPTQLYPGQPYPGQPYPAQTFPAQTYPAQQYPAQQYPACNQYNTQSHSPAVVQRQVIIRDGTGGCDSVQYRNVGILSMITCLFCCCPLGSIALYKVFQSSQYAKAGERQLAQLHLHSAQKWAVLGIILGIGIYILMAVRNMLYS